MSMLDIISGLEKALEEEVQVSLNAAKKILELKQEIKELKVDLIDALRGEARGPISIAEGEEIDERIAKLIEDLGDDYEKYF